MFLENLLKVVDPFVFKIKKKIQVLDFPPSFPIFCEHARLILKFENAMQQARLSEM